MGGGEMKDGGEGGERAREINFVLGRGRVEIPPSPQPPNTYRELLDAKTQCIRN